jgi:hypothetical protein
VIATTIRAKEFPAEPDEEFFTGLAALAEELKHNVPGFVQGYFMRDADGGAVLMALWESERILDEVGSSDLGKYARAFRERYLPDDSTATRYDVPWQAVFGDEFSELARRRREEDPVEKEDDSGRPPKDPRG